ncbi:MAG: putative glycosyltransferase, partial [Anaerophaga sp.]|nr:putative glycosyltransferase [Anaerophaga sp.]
MHLFPIVLFCYNRPKHLKQTIEALKKNKLSSESDLFIFSDGYKGKEDRNEVKAVREIIRNISGFRRVVLRENDRNLGLEKSIIQGITEVFTRAQACIVLEDDIETSPYFLEFMNDGLRYYEDDHEIFSISGYCPPIQIPGDFPHEAFRFPRINSWGWGTWRDRWESVDWEVKDFDRFIRDTSRIKQLEQLGQDLPVMLLKQQTGQIGSWAVRFNQTCFNGGKSNVYPIRSLVKNIGIDDSGSHMKSTRKYTVKLSGKKISPVPSAEDQRIAKTFRRFYKPSVYRRTINFMKIGWYRILKI